MVDGPSIDGVQILQFQVSSVRELLISLRLNQEGTPTGFDLHDVLVSTRDMAVLGALEFLQAICAPLRVPRTEDR